MLIDEKIKALLAVCLSEKVASRSIINPWVSKDKDGKFWINASDGHLAVKLPANVTECITDEHMNNHVGFVGRDTILAALAEHKKKNRRNGSMCLVDLSVEGKESYEVEGCKVVKDRPGDYGNAPNLDAVIPKSHGEELDREDIVILMEHRPDKWKPEVYPVISVSYNANYLKKIQDAFSSTSITMRVRSTFEPTIVTNGNSVEHIGIIMPVRIQ